MLLMEGKIDVEEYFIRTSQETTPQKPDSPTRTPNMVLQEGEMYAHEIGGKILPSDQQSGTIRFITRNNEISIQIKENDEWFDVYNRIKARSAPFSGKISTSYEPLEDEQENSSPGLKDYLFQIQLVDGSICVYFD